LSEIPPEDFLDDSTISDSSGSSFAVTNDEMLMGDDGWVVSETSGGPYTGNVGTDREWSLVDTT
jgi:hypothetical protein